MESFLNVILKVFGFDLHIYAMWPQTGKYIVLENAHILHIHYEFMIYKLCMVILILCIFLYSLISTFVVNM